MEWVKISDQPIDENRIHFLTNGKTVFIKGTMLQPFLLQLFGEYTTICEFNPTHWTTLPTLPTLPDINKELLRKSYKEANEDEGQIECINDWIK